MKILVTGASGLLGGNLLQLLPSDWKIVGMVNTHLISPPGDHVQIIRTDLSKNDIAETLKPYEPFDAIINTAAFINVDTCEEEKGLAHLLNAELPKKLGEYAKERNIHLVHLSTDQVFDGKEGGYTEQSTPHPVNHYGVTKCAGDEYVQTSGCMYTVVRTNIFGFNIQNKNDFAGWILSALKKEEPLRLCTDIRISIILVNRFVQCIEEILRKGITGILNIGTSDSCSKYDFGIKLAKVFSQDARLISAITLNALGLKALRPRNMTLNVEKAQEVLDTQLPTIDQCIAQYKELRDNGYPLRLKELAATP